MWSREAQEVGAEPADPDPPQGVRLRGSARPRLDQRHQGLRGPHPAVRPGRGNCPVSNLLPGSQQPLTASWSVCPGWKDSEHHHQHLVPPGGTRRTASLTHNQRFCLHDATERNPEANVSISTCVCFFFFFSFFPAAAFRCGQTSSWSGTLTSSTGSRRSRCRPTPSGSPT